MKTLGFRAGHDTYLMRKLHRSRAALSREGRPNERSDCRKCAPLGQVDGGGGCGGGGGCQHLDTCRFWIPNNFPTCLILCLQSLLLKVMDWGAWVAQTVEQPSSARVMISQSVSSSPVSGSVLTAQNLEPVSDSVSPSLSAPPPFMLCLSLSQK